MNAVVSLGFILIKFYDTGWCNPIPRTRWHRWDWYNVL